MPNFKENTGYKKNFGFDKNPYSTSKPVNGEIRDASEILSNVPGYNPNTGSVMNTGAGGLSAIIFPRATAIKAAKALKLKEFGHRANPPKLIKKYKDAGYHLGPFSKTPKPMNLQQQFSKFFGF